MPSMSKMFRSSKKSKSCSELVAMVDEVVKPVEDVTPSKKRHSFTRKSVGRSLKTLLKGSSLKAKSPAQLEDSIRTADMSDSLSTPSWDHGSVTDTSLTMTPPRTTRDNTTEQDRRVVDFCPPTMESLEEEQEAPAEIEAEATEGSMDEVIEAPAEGKVYEAIEDNIDEVIDDAVDEAVQDIPEVVEEDSVVRVVSEEVADDVLEEPEPVEPSEGTLEGEHLEDEEERSVPSAPEMVVEVPEPPSVPRNEELLDLLNEANIKTEAHPIKPVQVVRLLEEPVLEVIEESEEETEEDATSDTASETESESTPNESAPQAITAMKVRDSIALAKSANKKDTSSSVWSPALVVLAAWVVLGGMMMVLSLQVEIDGFHMPDLQLPTVDFNDFKMPDLQMPNVDFNDFKIPELTMPTIDLNMPDLQMPSVDLSAWKSMDVPSMDWSELQAKAQALFGQVEEAPEEVVEEASSLLHGGCKGMYCGFY